MAQRAQATVRYQADDLAATLEFLKGTRDRLRTLRKIVLAEQWIRVVDVNGDYFEVLGLGYRDPDARQVLDSLNAPYNPATLHLDTPRRVKEFRTSRQHPWAEDRVM